MDFKTAEPSLMKLSGNFQRNPVEGPVTFSSNWLCSRYRETNYNSTRAKSCANAGSNTIYLTKMIKMSISKLQIS